jgi:Tol biopolymer transport system component
VLVAGRVDGVFFAAIKRPVDAPPDRGRGGQPRLVAGWSSNATEPDWSPDGQSIAPPTQSGGRFEVCVVAASGGDVTRLVPGEDPVWAPNSRTVICARRVGNGVRTLSLLDVPTRQTKDLPRLSGSCSQPTWAR